MGRFGGVAHGGWVGGLGGGGPTGPVVPDWLG